MNQTNEIRIRFRPWIGLCVFIIEMAFMLLPGAWIQHTLGIWGAAVTEICILLFAVLGMLAGKGSLRETFPLTPPPVSKFFGGAFMYAGAFFLNTALAAILFLLFPQASDSTKAISDMINSVSPAVAILIIAVLPAICEEALFRGLLIFSVRRLKPGWIILISGICFGIAHMDPIRFPLMFIMGAFLAYIDLKTDSLFLGMFFHFINNLISAVSVILSARSTVPADTVSPTAWTTIGSAMVMLGISLTAFAIGWVILNRKNRKR